MEKIKEYLKQARYIDEDIESKKREREIFYGTQIQSPHIRQDVVQEGNRLHYDDKYTKLMEIGESIDSYIEQACMLRLEIGVCIDRVDDGLHKAILRDYYLSNLTWDKVAELNRQSVRNIHTMHRKALIEFKDMNMELF